MKTFVWNKDYLNWETKRIKYSKQVYTKIVFSTTQKQFPKIIVELKRIK